MIHYALRDGLKYCLQCRQEGSNLGNAEKARPDTKEFPEKDFDWVEQYYRFEEYMNKNWHPNVNLGAAKVPVNCKNHGRYAPSRERSVMGDKIKRMLQNEIQQMETQRAGNLLTGSRPLLCRRNSAKIILRHLRFQEIVQPSRTLDVPYPS